MPKALEQKLKREAHARGYSEERTNAFVYGTLRKTGWKSESELHDKIAAMDREHTK